MGANDETADADALPVADPGNSPAIGLFERLPEWVLDTLSNEQKEAIHQAAEDPAWVRSPVDIRFTIPFLGKNSLLPLSAALKSEAPSAVTRNATITRSAPPPTFSSSSAWEHCFTSPRWSPWPCNRRLSSFKNPFPSENT